MAPAGRLDTASSAAAPIGLLDVTVDPYWPGRVPLVLTGTSYAQRWDAASIVVNHWRDAGVSVLIGATPMVPMDAGPPAVYEALIRSPQWVRSRRGAQVPPLTELDPPAWAAELALAAGDRPFVVLIDRVDMHRSATVAFFSALARALADHRSPGTLVLNPIAGPGDSGHPVAAHDPRRPQVHPRDPAHDVRLHPEVRRSLAHLTDDPYLRRDALKMAVRRGEVLAVDGVSVLATAVTMPPLPPTHSAVGATLPLEPAQRQVLGLLGLLGPMSSAEVQQVAQTARAGQVPAPTSDAVAELAARGLITIRDDRWVIGSGLIDVSSAATIRPALAQRYRARLAALRSSADPGGLEAAPGTRRPTQRPLVPSVQAFLAAGGLVDPADPSGEPVIDYARQACAANGPDVGSWSCLAAVILLGRARVHRADDWLRRAAEASPEPTLLAHARTERERLLAGLTSAAPPLPELLSGAEGLFVVHDRMGRMLTGQDAAQLDDESLAACLRIARLGRALPLWSRAAALARRRGLPAGPALVDAQGRSDVDGAVLSMLAAGWSTLECAQALGQSLRATEKRITALYREAGCVGRAALIGAYIAGRFGNVAA